jgi:hypothetical protein
MDDLRIYTAALSNNDINQIFMNSMIDFLSVLFVSSLAAPPSSLAQNGPNGQLCRNFAKPIIDMANFTCNCSGISARVAFLFYFSLTFIGIRPHV